MAERGKRSRSEEREASVSRSAQFVGGVTQWGESVRGREGVSHSVAEVSQSVGGVSSDVSSLFLLRGLAA